MVSNGVSRQAARPNSGRQPILPDRRSKSAIAYAKERTLGNVLTLVGICLWLFMLAAFGHTLLEEWLDSQQRYVVLTTVDDWPLRPLVPMTSPTPPRPPPTLTASALAAIQRPTQDPGLPLNLDEPPKPAPVSTTIVVTIPVRIVIPKINVNSRIVEIVPRTDGTWGTAAYAVAYHKGTGKLGEADNIILSGHNNYQGEVFRRLSELTAGDTIKLYSADREYLYVVKETAIIPWVGASAEDRRRHLLYMLPTSEPTLTLISCWPYWVYTHRVYVVAKPTA